MRRAGLIVAALLAVASVNLFAQYGPILHAAAGQDPLSIGESIRLVGVASGSLRPEIGLEEARSTLQKLGVRLPKGADDSPITYGGFAFLLTQLFDLRSSITYSIFPGPRSAFKELRARGLVGSRMRSGQPLGGPDALLLLRRVVAARGAAR
jgi:hypothetical protein